MDRTLLIGAAIAKCTLILAIITGWVNIHVPDKINSEATIHKSQKLVVKERLKMHKIFIIFVAAVVIMAGIILYWGFTTAKLSFGSFPARAHAIIAIVLIVLCAISAIAFLNFVYMVSGAVHESAIRRRYSKFYEEPHLFIIRT